VRRAVARRSYCTLATSSLATRPHVVGVLYAVVDGAFFVATLETSTKVRNIRENPNVAVCIPVRRYPVGPPFSVQFQGKAEILPTGDPEIAELMAGGRLKRITSHGELDHPHACFLKVTPGRRFATYGLGVPLRKLLRDPIHASGGVEMS
jgi:nitroimidazol reductase NimA-like FMN-containing flavoprotein (pyridoxamine 5'-phosphate oxidase superfamily)